jgi:phosphoglycerol transferase MdoB-like AlkP superfamily enzyme
VWGISDKHLFLEANDILKQQASPFFAVIQTADNHRPYTIPEEDLEEFSKKEFPTDTLKKYGFESNAELNAFRYTDFSYQKFIEAAKKEKYFAKHHFCFYRRSWYPWQCRKYVSKNLDRLWYHIPACAIIILFTIIT